MKTGCHNALHCQFNMQRGWDMHAYITKDTGCFNFGTLGLLNNICTKPVL